MRLLNLTGCGGDSWAHRGVQTVASTEVPGERCTDDAESLHSYHASMHTLAANTRVVLCIQEGAQDVKSEVQLELYFFYQQGHLPSVPPVFICKFRLEVSAALSPRCCGQALWYNWLNCHLDFPFRVPRIKYHHQVTSY